MSLSNILPGKARAIELGERVEQQRPDRPSHAPMFARPGEPEPNAVAGERLQPSRRVPRREATRTLAEARKLGLSMPEALDLTPKEIASSGR